MSTAGRGSARRWFRPPKTLVAGVVIGLLVITAAIVLATGTGRAPGSAQGDPYKTAPCAGPSTADLPSLGCEPGSRGRFIPCPTSGSHVVDMPPGVDAQQVVDAHPGGTTFHLRAGTFAGFSVKPKAGDRFCGDGIGRTILDGQGQCISAIANQLDPSIDDVTIKNLTARNYCTAGSTDHRQVTFNSDSLNHIGQRASGWKVVSIEVADSNVGVAVGNNSYVAGNRFFHNYRSGMKGGGNNSVFEYNTLDGNDWFGRDSSIDGDSQGSKSAVTDHVVYRYNYVVNTSGPGLWVDTLNSNCLFDHNVIEHLGDSGIFVEASYNCTVRDNVIKQVGLQDNAAPQVGAGIEISTSGPVHAYRNYIIDSHRGIVVHQEERGADRSLGNYRGEFCANGGYIHDNYLLERPFQDDVTGQTLTPASGWLDGGASPGCKSAAANTWNHNHYYLDDTERAAWLVDGRAANWPQWQADGRDADGTVAGAADFPALPAFPVGQSGYAPPDR